MARRLARAATWLAVITVLALLAKVAQSFVTAGYWLAVALIGVVAVAVLAVYGTRRAVPMKYLLPGLVLMCTLQIWPIVYTAVTSTTNAGDGHTLTKAQSIEAIVAGSVREVPGSHRYRLSVAVRAGQDPTTGAPAYLLVAPDGALFIGTASGLAPLPADRATLVDGRITAAEGYQVLDARTVNTRQDLTSFAVPTSDGGGIKRVGLSDAFEGRPTLRHDASADALVDIEEGTVYRARDARWVSDDGRSLPQGWKEYVGAANFTTVVTDPILRAGFVGILAWNIAFAALSVLLQFGVGMLVALLLDDDRIRGRGLIRSILILPYALPPFVTALVWLSLFNQDYGLVNGLSGLHVDWLGDPGWARAAALITSTWMGFPYMFLICTGALQSIPEEVLDAAKVDGASAWRTLTSVRLPLLLVSTGPLLLASFSFNFNNFGLIYLLTGGGPFQSGTTAVGATDLLITYAFRLAFGGSSPNYGLASAVSLVIFVLVALLSWSAFRKTAALEEIS
ncbi:carbohydrate ABC transporter membrane protein 1, CUT1 family [Austwickia chelonae]|uniref:Maltose/maltodextrin transport system permease protein n=1 Tax=Austwickia chelonae NBRC 105200 TaxID=1184607 RepID=K6VMC6_9MICO|nr:ABC transporter permease subunit [Austwickia chelonae]GAB77899.1 putative ABC transporter permease protein [Austwickia chelonae NBRC 105200]SEV91799.1 carbohydrate ABC transporter membrane protein 1, CUT1 family [Austwickia chelonae]